MKTTRADRKYLHLRLICLRPPVVGGTTFGLRERDGTVHVGERHGDGAVSYAVSVPIVCREGNAPVRSSGPFVHGTAAAPFLYLNLKRGDAHLEPWVRRLKIPLPTLTWDEVARTTERSTLVGRISGEGSGTVALDGDAWDWNVSA